VTTPAQVKAMSSAAAIGLAGVPPSRLDPVNQDINQFERGLGPGAHRPTATGLNSPHSPRIVTRIVSGNRQDSLRDRIVDAIAAPLDASKRRRAARRATPARGRSPPPRWSARPPPASDPASARHSAKPSNRSPDKYFEGKIPAKTPAKRTARWVGCQALAPDRAIRRWRTNRRQIARQKKEAVRLIDIAGSCGCARRRKRNA